jgi:hypothetical protein
MFAKLGVVTEMTPVAEFIVIKEADGLMDVIV